MPRHRGGRGRVSPKLLRRADAHASSPEQQRRDIVTRYAILKPHSSLAWMCRQLNGRMKASYRTRQVAVQVAELLAILDSSRPMRPYRCNEEYGTERIGVHWHLKSC